MCFPCLLESYSGVETAGVVMSADSEGGVFHRCHPILVAFVWEFTKETIDLPLGCLQRRNLAGASAGLVMSADSERGVAFAPCGAPPAVSSLQSGLNLTTAISQKCEALPRSARI